MCDYILVVTLHSSGEVTCASLAIVCTLGQQSTFDSVLYCIRINTFEVT
eukprot:COSAG01_NODE_16676_length_1216_cov_1.014324_1_plen_48_part_10